MEGRAWSDAWFPQLCLPTLYAFRFTLSGLSCPDQHLTIFIHGDAFGYYDSASLAAKGSLSASLTLSPSLGESRKSLRLDLESGLIAYDAARTKLELQVRKNVYAILLDRDGLPIAQASQDADLALDAAGPGASLLLRETLAAAERLQQGAVGEVLLEAERMTVAMIPLRNSCCLCLFLGPEAVLGRSLFEARKAAFALEQSL